MADEIGCDTVADDRHITSIDSEGEGRRGLFGKFGARFNDALQNSRGPERAQEQLPDLVEMPAAAAPANDDLAIRRQRQVKSGRMVIPEGVTIQGNLSGACDTEISGRIEGDVLLEGRVLLGNTAVVAGNLRAVACRVDGLVEGKVECAEDLELGETGRLNGDVMVGKRINVAGQVYGNVTTPGVLRLGPTSKVNGDIRIKSLIMEEGAFLNGSCSMRPASQRSESKGK